MLRTRNLSDDEPDNDVALIEQRIEQLSRQITNCQKISLGSKVAIAVGGGWLGFTLLGLVTFAPAGALAALTAIIGGIVLLGSNSRTWSELETERVKCEAERAARIGLLPLRVVGSERSTH